MSNIDDLKKITSKVVERFNHLSNLSEAIEQANEAVLITTADLDAPGPFITFVNSAFTKMTGYSREDAIGKSPRILQGPKTDKDLISDLKHSLKTKGTFFGRTINYRKDGSEYILEWHIASVRDEDGNVISYVSIQRALDELPIATREDVEELKSRIDTSEI